MIFDFGAIGGYTLLLILLLLFAAAIRIFREYERGVVFPLPMDLIGPFVRQAAADRSPPL